MHFYCRELGSKEMPAWEKLVNESSMSGFHQLPQWARFKEIEGWKTYKIGLFSHKNILVGGAIVYQFCFPDTTNFLYIPEGPILNFSNKEILFWQWRTLETAIHQHIDVSGKKFTTHLRIEPRIEKIPEWFLIGWEKAPFNLMPRNTQVLDLTIPREKLFAQMKPKGRYNIHLSERKGVSIVEKPLTDIDIFYMLYRETYIRDAFEGKGKLFYYNFVRAFRKKSRLFVAEYNTSPLAAAIVVYCGSRATYLFGASSNTMRNFMAPAQLHWYIIQDAQRGGYTEYDFWGVAPSPDDTGDDWHGITLFKKKFGGHQLNFIGAYDYILNPDLYQNFVQKFETPNN